MPYPKSTRILSVAIFIFISASIYQLPCIWAVALCAFFISFFFRLFISLNCKLAANLFFSFSNVTGQRHGASVSDLYWVYPLQFVLFLILDITTHVRHTTTEAAAHHFLLCHFCCLYLWSLQRFGRGNFASSWTSCLAHIYTRRCNSFLSIANNSGLSYSVKWLWDARSVGLLALEKGVWSSIREYHSDPGRWLKIVFR